MCIRDSPWTPSSQWRELGVQGWQDMVGQLDEVDVQAAGGQGLNGLETDEAGADDDGAGGLPGLASRVQQLFDALPQSVDVGHGAQGVYGGVVQALDGRTHSDGCL